MAVNRRKVMALAVKIEATSGTDAVPALATDAIACVGLPTIAVADAEAGKRDDVATGRLGVTGRAAPKGRLVTISNVVVELRGKGSAYTAATDTQESDVLLRGAGMVKSFASTKLTYADIDTGTETFTAYGYASDGYLYKVVGCVFVPKLLLTAGQTGKISGDIRGFMLAEPAPAAITGLTLPSVIPPLWADTTAAIGAWSMATPAPNALSPKNFTLAFGLAIAERRWAGAGVIQGLAITDRKPRAEMDVEAVAQATFDPHARAAEAQGTGAVNTAITTQLPGGTGNTIDIATGQWQLERPQELDLSGLAGWKLQGDILAGTLGTPVNKTFAISFS